MRDGAAPQTPRFNLAHHLLDARVEEGRGDRPALLGPAGTVTYGALLEQSQRLAAALRQAGVGMEDRVLLALEDGPAFVSTFFAALRIGAVVTMVNPHLPVEAYAGYLDYTRAKACVLSSALAGPLATTLRAATQLRAVLVVGDDPAGFSSFSQAIAEAVPHLPCAPTDRDDFALWLFTSGSTGRPKGAVHTHGNFAYNIEHYAKGVLAFGPDDVTLAASKLFFGYATGMNLLFPLAVGGATVLFPQRATPALLFDLIQRHRPTVFSTVPTMMNKMLALSEAEGHRYDLSSLRLCVSAGEALPPSLYTHWKETFQVEVLDGLGSAEMFHIFVSNRPGQVRPGTLGQPVPGYEIRVVRPDGGEAQVDEPGVLWVRGGSAALFYFGDVATSRQVFRGQWVVTGDMVRRDRDGFVHYEGRADDLLKVGGIFVSPLEVESTLSQHPSVTECAVVGYEDDAGLVKPMAFVVPRVPTSDEEALWQELALFLRERLAPYKLPRRWQRMAELPRNDRGKLDRRALLSRAGLEPR